MRLTPSHRRRNSTLAKAVGELEQPMKAAAGGNCRSREDRKCLSIGNACRGKHSRRTKESFPMATFSPSDTGDGMNVAQRDSWR